MDTKRIYLIDDDAECLTSLSFLLKSYGYECLAFTTAADFIAALPPNAVGVLLTDHRLTDSNSLSIMQQLDELEQSLPVIVLSGRTEFEVAEQIRNSRAVGLLHKPINSTDLTKMIETAFGL